MAQRTHYNIFKVNKNENDKVVSIHCGAPFPYTSTTYTRVQVDGERYFMLPLGKKKLYRPNKQTKTMQHVCDLPCSIDALMQTRDYDSELGCYCYHTA